MVRLLTFAAIVPGALWAAGAERYAVRPHRQAGADGGDDDHLEHVAQRSGRRARLAFKSVAVFLASMGVSGAQPDSLSEELAKELKKQFDEYDTNQDGKIGKDEFMASAQKQLDEAEKVDDTLRERVLGFQERLFKAGDIDADGFLNMEEFQYAEFLQSTAAIARIQHRMKKVLGSEDGETEDEPEEGDFGLRFAVEQLVESDSNNDGVIDKDEYMKAMKQTAVNNWGWGDYVDDPEVNEWLDELFKRVDVTGDGVLDGKEVHYTSFLGDWYFKSGQFSDRTMATTIMTELDGDKDGLLSEDEIKEIAAEALTKRQEAFEELKERRARLQAKRAEEKAALEGGEKAEDDAEEAKAEDEAEEEKAEPEEPGLDEVIPLTIVERLMQVFADADGDGDKRLDKQELVKASQKMMGAPGEL